MEALSFDQFDFLQTLGTGSFGRVSLVKKKSDGKFFAIKALKKAMILRHKQVKHIRSERDILVEIDHPFLVNMCVLAADHTAVVPRRHARARNSVAADQPLRSPLCASRPPLLLAPRRSPTPGWVHSRTLLSCTLSWST